MEPLVNKVAESGIITIDLSLFLPDDAAVMAFDLKPFLFREMILREKDYREALKQQDWSLFTGKKVHICCTVDAIIPLWAYMLAAAYLQPAAATVFFGHRKELDIHELLQAIDRIDVTEYTDKRIVIKGCGDISIPEQGYVAVTAKLLPVVRSLMYGEPCSTVPVFKKPVQRP
jgi:hypothetical protein